MQTLQLELAQHLGYKLTPFFDMSFSNSMLNNIDKLKLKFPNFIKVIITKARENILIWRHNSGKALQWNKSPNHLCEWNMYEKL